MGKIREFAVKMNDESWLTTAYAAQLLECAPSNFANLHGGKFRTLKFAGVNFINLEELIEYNNARLYMKAMSERKNSKKNDKNE